MLFLAQEVPLQQVVRSPDQMSGKPVQACPIFIPFSSASASGRFERHNTIPNEPLA